ncbi:hypothetical protein SESBI_18320 [Sesbania bispinosa]|nr:hypothetical protein SESBI_18320 [Sesbania bispinosa]
MANYAIAHNCEVNLLVEHVSVAVPNLIDSLLGPKVVKETQVQKGGNCDGQEINKGVNRKDKGSDESFDGSLEDFFFDDNEEERMFGNDDGLVEVEKQNFATEQTTNADGNPHTEGAPNATAPSHTEGVPHSEGTPHNEGASHTEGTPQRSRGIRMKSVPSHNPIRSPQKSIEEM